MLLLKSNAKVKVFTRMTPILLRSVWLLQQPMSHKFKIQMRCNREAVERQDNNREER